MDGKTLAMRQKFLEKNYFFNTFCNGNYVDANLHIEICLYTDIYIVYKNNHDFILITVQLMCMLLLAPLKWEQTSIKSIAMEWNKKVL